MNAETLDELINKVNCGIRKQYPAETRYRDVKPHWWSWKTVREPYEFTPDPEYYNLDDSLGAIEILGESGDPHALKFLEKIYTPEIDTESERVFISGGSEPRDDDWKVFVTVSVIYPHAKGSLREALRYIVGSYDYYEDSNEDEPSTDDYADKLTRGELPPPENEKAHIVLKKAIHKLQNALEK